MGIVGRGRELGALRGRLEQAQAGRGRVVICGGEAGIGKTRLAQEFAGSALATGAAVVSGRCIEGEGAPAYWPWRQVLKGLKVDADGVLAGDDRFRLFEAVTEAIATAAGAQGLVVLLDDRALADALHARQEACPGPAGRAERLLLATEMLDLAQRTDSPRAAMWGELWRLDALIESGRLAAAAEELPALKVAVDRVGGPVSAWHHDRVAACIAQARGRNAEAAALSRRGFERMRVVEKAPATGAHVALLVALAGHLGVSEDITKQASDPPPRFAMMAHLSRAYLQTCAGLTHEAAASYRQAGPIETWSLPAFFVLPGYVYAALACAGIGRYDDLEELLRRLEPFRGEHAAGNGVAYMGPIELTLGRGAAVLGRLDDAIEDLTAAVHQADCAGAPGFVAEAQYHLARALLDRNQPGDRARAEAHAQDAARLADSLGMTAYQDKPLITRTALSTRETEVAALVADGLTNKQIAAKLVISERTAQNHVQHILTKLGFATRSQIATWATRGGFEYSDE
ncbi:LuxR C-terminal-related transcriptional regulator [Kribbella catacumbae]|uniref:LuxR C-terminal-related transcriptional regulator n=1 Tax=Kribbella catacumbae TaxID=460086 RepID=UPI000362F368|nr:LuxR C-terminal-related transcriptional regulator [Kribbella catacumbae]